MTNECILDSHLQSSMLTLPLVKDGDERLLSPPAGDTKPGNPPITFLNLSHLHTMKAALTKLFSLLNLSGQLNLY